MIQLPLKSIFKSNTLPQLVTRVAEIVDVLNHLPPSVDFGTIEVAGQANVVADLANTALIFVAGNNVTITANSNTKTLTFSSATTAAAIDFGTVLVAGQANIVADIANTALTFAAGNNVSITANSNTKTLTFSATGGGGNGVGGFLSGMNVAAQNTGATVTFLADSANTALFANDAAFLDELPGSYYSNAANLTGMIPAICLPLANTTVNGAVSIVAQSFAGVKTFTDLVSGTLQLTGTLSANGGVGSNNAVLTSNGGPAYWAPPAGGTTLLSRSLTLTNAQMLSGLTPIIIIPAPGPGLIIGVFYVFAHIYASSVFFNSGFSPYYGCNLYYSANAATAVVGSPQGLTLGWTQPATGIDRWFFAAAAISLGTGVGSYVDLSTPGPDSSPINKNVVVRASGNPGDGAEADSVNNYMALTVYYTIYNAV